MIFFLGILAAGLATFAGASDIQDDIIGTGIAAVFPNDERYQAARAAFNRRYDPHPETVTFPSTAEEVAQIVKIGVENGVPVVARSGGHSYIANGLVAPIVVDLRNMTDISITSDGVASIQAGSKIGDIALALNDIETGPRAIPHGSCPFMGIGGHLGHGGFGFPSRMWGLALDAVISMQVVLANGSVATASSSENSDLFWALRGAASSFGIITSIDVHTYDAPSYAIIYGYNWQLNYTQAAAALDAYQSYVSDPYLPPELGSELVFGRGETEGTLYFGFTGGWYGQEDALNTTLDPLLSQLPPPAGVNRGGDGTWLGSVADLGGGIVNTSEGTQGTSTFYAKSLVIPEEEPLSSKATLAFMKYLAIDGFASETSWFMQLELYGGGNSAINSVPQNDTSFLYRNALFTCQFYAATSDNEPPYPDSGFTFLDNLIETITSAMPKKWAYGAYINYIDERLEDYVDLYYGDHYPRLQEIKRDVDPGNLFRFPTAVQV